MDSIKFDTGKFVLEVQKRPAIWNKCASRADSYKKLKQWREIVNIYSGDAMISAAKKRNLELELKQKWRNIRDCFVKAHKAKTTKCGSAATKKKPYAYYNNLLFLIESQCFDLVSDVANPQDCNRSEEQNGCQAFAWTSQNIKSEFKAQFESDSSNAQSDADVSRSSWQPKEKKRNKKRDESEDNDDQCDSVVSQWEVKRTGPEVPVEVPMEASKNVLEDDDRLFFLSLVKEFRKIPEHAQLQTKLDILKVMQEAQRS